jgi:hypothetical protein
LGRQHKVKARTVGDVLLFYFERGHFFVGAGNFAAAGKLVTLCFGNFLGVLLNRVIDVYLIDYFKKL